MGERLSKHLGAAAVSREERVAALEAYVPQVAKAEYALIGGEFRPDDSGCLSLIVLAGDGNGRLYEPLADGVDHVRVGLPSEFASAVVKSVVFTGPAPSGVITINCAAYGIVGSNARILGRVAPLFVTLVYEVALSDEQLRRCVLDV